MGLDGNSLIKSINIQERIPDFHRLARRAQLLVMVLGTLSVWVGCAKKPIIPTEIITVPNIRVALDEQLSQGTLRFLTPYRLNLEEASYLLDSTVGTFQVSWENRRLTFRSPSRFFSFEKFSRIECIPLEKGEFNWKGIPYHGKIIFARNENAIVVINELLFPDYLRGVVPYEIPSHSEEYYQAVVSQTIAAATYAYYALKNPVSPLFDIYADNRDQIYQGNRIRTALVDKAVMETKGLILQNADGQAIRVQYHSTCGGVFDQFPVNSSPAYSSGFLHDSWNEQVNCAISPQFRWVRQLTAQDVLDNLSTMGLLKSLQTSLWKNQGFTLEIEIASRKTQEELKR